jgi:hypothetical protein
VKAGVERATRTLPRTLIDGIVSLCFALMLNSCFAFSLWMSITARIKRK